MIEHNIKNKKGWIKIEDLKVLKSNDLMKMFGFGKTKMNQVLQSGVLPVTKLGGEYITTEDQIREWFKRNQGKKILL